MRSKYSYLPRLAMNQYQLSMIQPLIKCYIVAFIWLLPVCIFGQSISIISWNLKDFGQSRDDEEIMMIAEVIRDADIVAIQEVVAKHHGGAQGCSTSC